jgi:hypothetical protein
LHKQPKSSDQKTMTAALTSPLILCSNVFR